MALLVLALLGAVIIGAPFVGADRFAEAIHRGLENKLGRRVELRGDVRFRAFPRPGFSVENPLGGSSLVIHELPSIGIEPVAYVERLEVSVGLASLLRGRVELAGIRLVNPSVNLMQVPGVGWNLQPLIRQALGKGSFPQIEVTGGRLNFKQGTLKSVFYLAETDLLVEADLSDASRFGIRVEGEPARTDQGTRAFGRLSGRGMLTWPEGSAPGEARLEMSLSVERSAIAGIASLAAGRPVNINGFVASRFHLSGPLSDLAIDGTVELDQVERAVLFARTGSGLALRGRFRLDDGQLRMETADTAGATIGQQSEPGAANSATSTAPVSAQLNVESLFSQPAWTVLFGLRDLPAGSLRAILDEMGYAELSRLPVEGLVNGSLAWSPPTPANGTFSLTSARIEQQPPLELESAEIVVANESVQLRPALLRMGRQTMTASAEWQLDSGAREVRLQTSGMPARDLRRLIEDLLRAPAPWILAWSGNWSGTLQMSHAGTDAVSPAPESAGAAPPALWTGPLRVTGAKFPLEELGGKRATVEIESAAVSLRGSSWAIRGAEGTVAGLPVRFDASSDGTVNLRAGQLEAAQLEDILRMLAQAPDAAPSPSRPYRAKGTIAITRLTAGRLRAAGLRARFYWNGPALELRDVSGTVAGAPLRGSISVALGDDPVYRGNLSVRGISWQLGSLDMEGEFDAAGSGAEIASSLRWQGSFSATDVKPPSGSIWERTAGCFVYQGGPASPRLQLSAVEVESGGELFLGRGAGSDGRFQMELVPQSVENAPPARVTGRIGALNLEVTAGPGTAAAADKAPLKQN
ncbi:MAG: hypothetical protein R2762_05245 [Bryobacteraceae bacterium]